jgi:hypothetical protein
MHPARRGLVKPGMLSLFNPSKLPKAAMLLIKKDTASFGEMAREIIC